MRYAGIHANIKRKTRSLAYGRKYAGMKGGRKASPFVIETKKPILAGEKNAGYSRVDMENIPKKGGY